jgi:hypothetical protein
MRFAYLSDYERLCLSVSIEEIARVYPKLPVCQIERDVFHMKSMDKVWQKAIRRRLPWKLRVLIYRLKAGMRF